MPKIRRYQSKDFVDYAATLEKTSPWEKKAASELKARLEKLKRGDQVWVAEVNIRCVGFMIVTSGPDGTLEVDWLDVHPDFQRTGIGTLLVDRAAKIAKTRRLQTLGMHTQPNNEKMIGFVTKNGFELHERLRDFYGKRKDALRFKKRLPLED
jgi:ribosomal protein S18 acetylase RimI-like enzyme